MGIVREKTATQRNVYDGVTVDVSDLSKNLTGRMKRFVAWFCFPGTDAFQNKTKAAIAAGYAHETARMSGYKLCKNPDVISEIERVSKNLNTETVDTLYRKYVNALETRAFFDPADFMTGTKLKPLGKIPLEKRLCIEQVEVDVKGGKKTIKYQFGSRRAAMAEIRELYEKQHPGGDIEDGEDTREIIMERIIVRETKRADRIVEAEYEIVEAPDFSDDGEEEEES